MKTEVKRPVPGMPFAQGDAMFFPVSEIPEGVIKQEPDKEGNLIVAHSESGHNHILSSDTVDFYMPANDEFIGFLEVKAESNLTHLRSFDTHETIAVPPGKYRITRQREYMPSGFRRAAD